MPYKHIIYQKEGAIARITINKPEKLNALQLISVGEDFAELLQGFHEAEEDDDIKVIILKGAGRAFSTGQDLTKVGFLYGFGTGKKGERRPSQRIRLKMDQAFGDGLQKMLLCPKLTIAQAHGYCIEGGLLLAMACDFIICTEDARLGYPGQRLGFAGCGDPGFVLLYMSIGLRRALDLFITGRLISGKEAAEIGLVTKAVPSDKLIEEVEGLAKSLSLYPRDGIAIGKATRHLWYDHFGLPSAMNIATISHTLFTNLRYETGEWSFFKERRDKGAKAAFHERDKLFEEPLGR